MVSPRTRAVHARRQLTNALTLLAYGIAALASLSLALSQFASASRDGTQAKSALVQRTASTPSSLRSVRSSSCGLRI
jgi:hypothetical protein